MKEVIKKIKYPGWLLVTFLLIWIILAISPRYRGPWFAENILTVLFVAFLILTYRKFRFSNLSYTFFFLFLVLHTIGSHYTYTEMPLFEIIKDWFNLGRNHYDRVIHFIFGLLFFYPTYEFISKELKLKGFWGFLLAFLVIASLKGIYEILEYLYLLITKSEIIGTHFLGMQGDQWDVQKDMILGMVGSLLAWLGISLTKKK